MGGAPEDATAGDGGLLQAVPSGQEGGHDRIAQHAKDKADEIKLEDFCGDVYNTTQLQTGKKVEDLEMKSSP